MGYILMDLDHKISWMEKTSLLEAAVQEENMDQYTCPFYASSIPADNGG